MSLLMNVQYEDELNVYYIRDESVLPKNLLEAIKKLHGVYCNSEDFTEDHYKPWAYVSAAMTAKRNPNHLSAINEFNENRFAHLLEQYRIDRGHRDDDPMVFTTEGPLYIVQTGSF